MPGKAASPPGPRAPLTPSPLPHPDDVTGALSQILQRFAEATPNTLADLDVYRRISLDALFPAPQAVPAARVTTRWRLPGVVSEDIVFPSLHEPLEPRFRERYVAEYAETHTVYARRIRPAVARWRSASRTSKDCDVTTSA